jgi:ribosomal protein S18 acetylase RimI-like enzyme
MGLTYFKRYRMEIDLRGRSLVPIPLPPHYRLIAWDRSLIDAHAEAKFHSFRTEIDANVFPCLGEADGCRRLMNEIARKDGFLPEATWLLAYDVPGEHRLDFCGTVQGIRDRSGTGAIQNLGVTPEHRNSQLGSCLLIHALAGFQAAGLPRAYLEVTAQNSGAIRLYHRMGFVTARTVYKAVEVAYS